MAITDMTFEFVANMLKSTELKNMGVTNNKQDLVNLINMVLIDLHNRFVLNKGIVDVPLEHNKYIYDLNDYFVDPIIPEESEDTEESTITSLLLQTSINLNMKVGEEQPVLVTEGTTYIFSISPQSVLNWDNSVANETQTGVLRAISEGEASVKLILINGADNDVVEFTISVTAE